ncbi:MAG: VWA domain-containing protein [Planctomycetaceae bacterium]
MLIFIAVLLVVFVGVIAFSVDVAYMHLARTELRTASDAAARGAGEALSRTQNLDIARQAAKDVAALNTVDGKPLTLDDADIVTGNSSRQSSGKWKFTAAGTPLNAFRVTGRKQNGSASGSVGLFFAPMFGVNDYEVAASATSVRFDRDIVLVVDRSSSMKLYLNETRSGMSIYDWRVCAVAQPQSRWVALEGAVNVFLSELRKTPQIEYVGLASYASNFNYCGVSNSIAEINQNLSADTSLVSAAMNKITNSYFNGNTAIGEGIRRGNQALADPKNARPFARKAMVLLTDGVHNTGVSPSVAANEALAQGVVIYTITFGTSADQTAMKAVASTTGGKHYHAPDQAALVAAFREIALSLSVILTE